MNLLTMASWPYVQIYEMADLSIVTPASIVVYKRCHVNKHACIAMASYNGVHMFVDMPHKQRDSPLLASSHLI